jgi:hypothetical protein
MRRRKTTRYNFLPKINLPSVNLPKVNLPKVEMPHVNLPKVNLPKINLPVRQLMILVFLVIMALAMINLNDRLREYSRLTSERDALQGEVAVLQVTSQGLATQLAYAVSDKAVEEYARNSHRVREGEKLVVVLTPQGNLVSTPPSRVTLDERSAQKWEVWWALFFAR